MSIQENAVLRIRLREMMDRHYHTCGERLTYAQVSEMVGLAPSTIESMASRPSYNPTLKTLAKLCVALQCSPGDLLVLEIDANFDGNECKDRND